MDHETILARRAAEGDSAAFAALVRMHEARVRRFLGRLAGGDADDLAQEVFLKAWRMAGSWREDGSYGAWLMRIAWTGFLTFHKAHGRRAARDQAAFDPDALAVHRDADTAIDLERALTGLSERERAAALLCFGEGCSHSEAAAILGIPLGTLKSLVLRARAQLVAYLETGHG